jgi:hypothetical protein
MSTAPQPSRHDARIPGLPQTDDAVPGAPRKLFYELLARVSVRHEYYAATGFACRDFTMRPTRHTAALLKGLGLLFREEDDGFSVLYNGLQRETLLEYVRGKARSSDDARPWGRLCFVLSLRNPWFVNFTELPLNTATACLNFYLTNRFAHVDDDRGAVLLSAGDEVSTRDLVPVTGEVLIESVDPGVAEVRVQSVSGREVLCALRCAPAGETPPAPRRGKDAPAADCTDRMYFDLSSLPEGKYTVQRVMADGATQSRGFLYTAAHPVPLGLVELLLASPGGSGGVYPVRDLGAESNPVPVQYEIFFAARRTWWNYYVLAQPPRGERGELRIRQRRSPGEPRVTFLGPCPVQLAGGRAAWRFVSRQAVALARRPTLHLQLVWRREGSRRVDVLMDRLPLADGRHLVQTDARGALQPSPPPHEASPPGFRCRRLEQWLQGNDPPPASPSRLFSDIYVHV